MTANKTVKTSQSVPDFLEAITDPLRKADTVTVCQLMQDITGWSPALWGDSIIGFGKYHYRYESGRTGEFMITGLSPRKNALTLYIMPGFADYEALTKALGPHKTGKSCLYIKRLPDIDLVVLRKLIEASVADMKERHTWEAS